MRACPWGVPLLFELGGWAPPFGIRNEPSSTKAIMKPRLSATWVVPSLLLAFVVAAAHAQQGPASLDTPPEFHPVTGVLRQAEIGPLGGDEVNWLILGHDRGGPLVSLGLNYTGTRASDQPWYRPGLDMPRLFWVPGIGPSSITFYAENQSAAWKGNLFVGARIRDVAQGLAGNLYVATEGGFGGGPPSDMGSRIELAEWMHRNDLAQE